MPARENPNPFITNFLRRIVFFFHISSRVFPPTKRNLSMADAGGANLDAGVLMEKWGCGHPRGSKNKPKDASVVASSSASVKRRPGRPVGSKNKPKVSAAAAPGSSAAPHNASPPAHVKTFSFFCIAGAQCREIRRVPLKFTKFMDGRELREAILREQSGGGTPYEVEVYYDGCGEMYFRGGWTQFEEDHDLHQGFFMLFDYHCGTSKFDVKIYDCTQCQKEYEAKVHFQ
jgi:hypothetical protein